jgi:hypothetical protein
MPLRTRWERGGGAIDGLGAVNMPGKGWRSRRIPLIGVALLVALVCALAVILGWRRPIQMTVQDPVVEVLSYKVSSGTNHVLYAGNQTLGRTKEWLKRRWNMNFPNRVALQTETRTNTKAFLVLFAGKKPNQGLTGFNAELVTRDGATLDLSCPSVLTSRTLFGGCFLLPPLTKTSLPCRLELKRPGREIPVVTWSIDRLN